MELNILNLISDEKCYDYLRKYRWKEGLICPYCSCKNIIKNGKSSSNTNIHRYECSDCCRGFNDLTNVVFANSNKPLKVWVMVLYFMGLNLSNRQIAQELDIDRKTAQKMTTLLRTGIVKKKPDIVLNQEVEIDEVYVVSGHKGQTENVKKAQRAPRRRRLKGARGRGTSASEKPPILGLVQRGGALVLRVLDNVQQATIQPIIEKHVQKQTLIYTDEYNIYGRLKEWGYAHKTVCHAKGEYARDEDGDGKHEVHVNTQEGIWSVLRSWLRPHRGISQEKLPIYVGFFEFVFNTKRRGKALLQDLFETILREDIREIEDLYLSPI